MNGKSWKTNSHLFFAPVRRLAQTIIEALAIINSVRGDAVNYFYRSDARSLLFAGFRIVVRPAFTAAAADKNGCSLKMPSRLSARRSAKINCRSIGGSESISSHANAALFFPPAHSRWDMCVYRQEIRSSLGKLRVRNRV